MVIAMAKRGGPVKYIVSPGQVFGRLTVVDPDARYHKGQRAVGVRCECGKEKVVLIYNLMGGKARSCGCARTENFKRRTHGMSGHPLLGTWQGIMERCESPGNRAYRHYGARGIRMHEPWRDFRNFAAWIEVNLGPRPDGMTLDRWPDNDGNYEPGNVRWATHTQQTRNQRSLSDLQLRLTMAMSNDWPAL